MGKIVGCAVLSALGLLCFIFSLRQFRGKGFLLNNAYMYASEHERETMDKTPLYKQTGVVLIFVGMICLLNALDIFLSADWLFYCVIALALGAVVYAAFSTVRIGKGK